VNISQKKQKNIADVKKEIEYNKEMLTNELKQ